MNILQVVTIDILGFLPLLKKASKTAAGTPVNGVGLIRRGETWETTQNPKQEIKHDTNTKKLLAAVCGASLLFAGAAAVQAKTLVFCSEGSPEGFNPAFYTAGTSFDASSRPIFNRLVEFERGTTKIGPALAEKWEVSDDGLEYTFHLRKGVKFHTTKEFQPTRDFNADDVVFLLQASA